MRLHLLSDMEPNSQYGGFSHASHFISLSTGGEARKDLMTLQSWSGGERTGTCNPDLTLHNSRESCSFNFFESSMTSKRKRFMRNDGRGGDVLSEEDVGLVLGLGCTHGSLKGGVSSGQGASLGTLSLQVGCLPMDLGLGLTQSSRCELSNDGLTSSREVISSITCSARACMDEVYQHGSLEAGIYRTSRVRQNSLQSLSLDPGDTIKDFGSMMSNVGENTCGVDLQLGLSGNPYSAESDCLSGMPLMGSDKPERRLHAMAGEHIVDEGSTSKRRVKSGGRIPGLMSTARASEDATKLDPNDFVSGKTSSIGTLAGPSDRASKRCNFKGCIKGARGASGLCIAHGGGRRCQRPNCNKGAEGRTMYCKAHGGGRRCEQLGCIKSAEGKTDFCIAHGGGRRCSYEGCNKAARGKSGLCIRHGGGKRCQREGCTKSAEGFSGLCISHGGGRRCQSPGCGKGAQGSTMFCKAHGGGRRCEFEGCTKGAEGSTAYCKAHGGGKRCMFGGGTCTKSVHGGTSFCVAHGGGKRCAVQGCSKSARGRTDFCVRHGGGKRCKYENCNKSAQGSTDFCKAHGGGKRCSWFQGGLVNSENISVDKALDHLKGTCDKFARGKTGLCPSHSLLMQQLTASWEGATLSSYSRGTTLDSFQEPFSASIHNGQLLKPLSDASDKPSVGNDHDERTETQLLPYEKDRLKDSWSRHHDRESESLDWTECNTGVASREDSTTDVASEDVSFDVSGRDRLSPCIRAPGCSFPGPAFHNKAVPAVNMATKSFFDVPHPHNASLKTVPPPEKVSVVFSTQRLIPLAMQKRDVLVPDNGQYLQNASTSFSSDDITNMFSMSVPEERVHGGGLMALLAREAARRSEHQ